MHRRRRSSVNDARILIANSLVDIDPDYAVSASDLPNRGTGGSGYDLDTNVGTAANRKIHPSGSCLLFGASGDYASTPDTAGNSITGDMDVIMRLAADDWSLGAFQTLICKGDAAPDLSYRFILNDQGKLILDISTNGTALSRSISDDVVPFTDGTPSWIRATWDADGDVYFYTSTEDTNDPDAVTWSQFGNAVANSAAIMNDSSESLIIGGLNGTSEMFAGTIYRAQIKSGIDGTLAVDFDPTKHVSGTTFSSGGVTFTLNGNAFIQNTGHDVLHSIGSNGLETAAGQLIASGSTIFAVARVSGTPSANNVIFSSRSDAANTTTLFTNDANSDKFSLEQGTPIAITGAFDNDPHVFTCQLNGDSTTKLTVSGIGSVTGSAGTEGLDFGTLLADRAGGSNMVGYIARLLAFDYALSETQVSAIQNYLSAYYGGI